MGSWFVWAEFFREFLAILNVMIVPISNQDIEIIAYQKLACGIKIYLPVALLPMISWIVHLDFVQPNPELIRL